MHSRKANKREVLKSLEEAIRFSAVGRSDTAIAARLANCRDKLNGWCRTIHIPIGRSGRTPFDVIGLQLKLRRENARLLQTLDAAAEWSAEKIESSQCAIDRAIA